MWQFFIDVGGTFTDVVAVDPDGALLTHKLLSSGVVRGTVMAGSTSGSLIDCARVGEPAGFWVGYEVALRDTHGGLIASARVSAFDGQTGAISVEPALNPFDPVDSAQGVYELRSHEEAPILAIRQLMGLRLNDPIGPVVVRLGTTRATNALLERQGARVAFVTTKGFADILRIGNQDRPDLFDLRIRKREEPASRVVEIDERITAAGEILGAPDETVVRRQLQAARDKGIEAVAICLLNSYVNPVHERLVANIARPMGFARVSVSSDVSRMDRIVPRGDTTVADAYLSPVIEGYIASLRRSLPEARLHLMTSTGGLIDASTASGKDTILSGPAGGVVGCAHVAKRAGACPAIAFDMGGTSTDVSRIDEGRSPLEYQHETVRAGVRIMTPMLAVETVAAGGGSICQFDGQKLVVGPQSAGADPGPACYGRGGPLTVTDMNVLLGRVVPEYFPFALDRRAVEERLERLCQEVQRETGSALSPVQAAEGFVRIANENMAAAVKRISLAKGYDVSRYTLCSFGGAGGQHACAIARMLGIKRVLFSPLAGVLSAFGIGTADWKRIGQRAVSCRLTESTEVERHSIRDELIDELRRQLLGEGVAMVHLRSPRCSYDVCYSGQSTTITVASGPPDAVREDFEARHRQLYGYGHDRRAVEVRVVRVELTASSSASPERRIGKTPSGNLAVVSPRGLKPAAQEVSGKGAEANPAAPSRNAPMVVAGAARRVPLFLRCELASGQSFLGPAILIEDTSTVVVESGWEANVAECGDVMLTFVDPASQRERISTRVDPIQLELFNNQFAAIAEQMGTTLRRTALSTNVRDRLDFSCAVFTPLGDLVVNAPHIPVHLGGMSECVKALIEDVDRMEPGGVYVTNDPYRGGSHLNDVTVVTPVHDDDGRSIVFFVASRAHHAEIGGIRPGSMPPDSTCLAEEGAVIRAFPLIQNGQARYEQLRDLLVAPPHPSRTPDENLADVAAQVAANQTGVRHLQSMIARVGLDVVHSYMQHIQKAAETKMRRVLRRLPNGIHRFEDRLDDGAAIRLAISIKDDSARFDFSGTDSVRSGNLNANRAIVSSAILYCLRCLIDDDIPLNSGVLAPIEIELPCCFLNPPSSTDPLKCPAMAGGNVETSQRIVDCILGALRVAAASQGTMNNLLIGNDRFGYYETICGGAGAGPNYAGCDAVHTHMTNTRMTDPEVLEARYPVRLVRFEIRKDSGGSGRFRGGDGVIREIEFLGALDLSILSQRRSTPPYGIDGGGSGKTGRNLLLRCGADKPEVLPAVARVQVSPGDRLIIETPGGGGWGVAASHSGPRP